MAEARFLWLVSNVLDVRTGRPIGGASPYVVRTFGSLRVGFFGIGLPSDVILRDETRIRMIPPADAAAVAVAALKKERVDVIVALTHLAYADDRALAERFPDIDLIVGGHEHFPIASTAGRTFITKAGTEARFVARIDLSRRPSGTVERFYELVPITSAFADDPATAAVVAEYESRLGTELDAVVATASVPLDGMDVRLRASETNLGNLVADAIREEAAADIAIVNSGGIRGDRVLQPGAITRRELLQLHPFGNVVCKLSVPGRIVLDALNNGVSSLPAAAGQFPQVSGLKLRVDARAPPGNRVRDVIVNGAPLDPERMYTIAIPDFVLLGGDGYEMFAGQKVLIDQESGILMATALEKYIAGRDVAPMVEGRISVAQ
jgi:2',3'-cyclic-nucleotide 2'-phosphodiesterase (5'-nucleotidase family)